MDGENLDLVVDDLVETWDCKRKDLVANQTFQMVIEELSHLVDILECLS